MEVKVRPPAEIELVISLGRDELDVLVEATRNKRRTKAQAMMLERLGDCLAQAVEGGGGASAEVVTPPIGREALEGIRRRQEQAETAKGTK